MSRALAPALAALVILSACGSKDDAKPADAAAAIERPEVDTTMAVVARGASVALAVDAMPTKADSILAAAGMTAEEYEALMYRIASDTLLSRLYEGAVRGR